MLESDIWAGGLQKVGLFLGFWLQVFEAAATLTTIFLLFDDNEVDAASWPDTGLHTLKISPNPVLSVLKFLALL
jgi:hypothetical protein